MEGDGRNPLCQFAFIDLYRSGEGYSFHFAALFLLFRFKFTYIQAHCMYKSEKIALSGKKFLLPVLILW